VRTPAFVAIGVAALSAIGCGRDVPSLESLAASAAALALDVERLEDENAIENLQRIYGFYTDKQLWSEAADLFADDGTIEVGRSGVYVGKERVLAYLRSQGPEFPQVGRLFDQMQLQPIIHVAPDGLTANGRWHLFAQEAMHGAYAHWGAGVYENGYVKDDGVWKIQSLHLFTTMYTTYEDGWEKTALPEPGPVADLPADRPPSIEYEAYPAVFIAPFHYANPVMSPATSVDGSADAQAAAANLAELRATLTSLEQRIGLLEDVEQLERLQSVYGYYLAHNEWDNFAGLFAPEGTIEIAMRGVYVGPSSVRRSMDLYGAAGSKHGLLHNHMQYQPVIHVAEDGRSAKMRSRAFSIMGEFERGDGRWMGGVYENEYVKQDGVWMLAEDRQFNTYFALYPVGWKDLVPRAPPQVSTTNPPDRPPTSPFEMYPRAFLPPYHYANPVTGHTVTLPELAIGDPQ
jgi:hypothetical protein